MSFAVCMIEMWAFSIAEPRRPGLTAGISPEIGARVPPLVTRVLETVQPGRAAHDPTKLNPPFVFPSPRQRPPQTPLILSLPLAGTPFRLAAGEA